MDHLSTPRNTSQFGFNLVLRLVQVVCIGANAKLLRTSVDNVGRRCALVAAPRGGESSAP